MQLGTEQAYNARIGKRNNLNRSLLYKSLKSPRFCFVDEFFLYDENRPQLVQVLLEEEEIDRVGADVDEVAELFGRPHRSVRVLRVPAEVGRKLGS